MFNYRWNLTDLKKVKQNNLKVFGTFVCAGGSSMGYKLAGYQHLGGVEIDKRCAELYKLNHNPKYFYNIDIREFNKLDNLPDELYNLDILDGSPPCSSFSLAGNREKDWGKEKKFREGQTDQTLDDLVFIYCETIKKLKPKIAILENVKGLYMGQAKLYLYKILKDLNEFYDSQVFLLNGALMGVPQKRERIFIVFKRKDLNFPKLTLSFNKKPIHYKEFATERIEKNENTMYMKNLKKLKITDKTQSDINMRERGKNSGFNGVIVKFNQVLPTITAGGGIYSFEYKNKIPDKDLILASSFPQDYNFNKSKVQYYVGMSVPPLMMANVAKQIQLQLFQIND